MKKFYNPGFFDLCINPEDTGKENLRRLLSRLYEMGYRNVAINQKLDESTFETEKKKKKKGEIEIPKPILIPLDLDDIKEEFKDKLCIYRRLTFSFGDSGKTYTLGQQQALKKYDLFSVMPKNQAALQFACTQLTADIITINPTSNGLKFNRKLYLQAVERGIHFEIQYSNAISPSTRKMTIHHSHLFHIYGKSKNIFISSGAKDVSMIRYPYDIINLAALFGLNETKAKAALLSQCKHLVNRAEGRRLGKTSYFIETEEVLKHDVHSEDEYSPDVKKLKIS